MNQYLRFIGAVTLAASALFLGGCVDATKPKIENYYPNYKQLPPQPVYSRLTWSQLPYPTPLRSKGNSPYLSPVISFNFPKTTLKGAIEALAQTMGYEPKYPADIADRKLAIVKEGTVDDLLEEISRQARIEGRFDHERRIVIVEDTSSLPRLPEGGSEDGSRQSDAAVYGDNPPQAPSSKKGKDWVDIDRWY